MSAQERPTLAQEIAAFAAEAASPQEPQSPAWQALTVRYRELLARLRAAASGCHGSDLAFAYIQMSQSANAIGIGGDEPARVLAELDQAIAARPGPPHGRSQLLSVRANADKDAGLPRSRIDEFRQLLTAFAHTDPKRIWIACEVARLFITVCDLPREAEDLLTKTLQDVEAMPVWDEATRAALARDQDLFVTDRRRRAAANRDDAIGQVLLLRGYARDQVGSLFPAIMDLQRADDLFQRTANDLRHINCLHNLASCWLQLGRYDQSIEIAKAAEALYREGVVNNRGDIGPDDNGVRAMQKVQAKALLRTGQLVQAEQLLVDMMTDRFVAGPGPTNVDALVTYAELLLQLPSTPQRERDIDRMLDGVRRYCGTDRKQLMLWRAELVAAQRLIAQQALPAARKILAEAAAPLEQHRHGPLQVRRQVLLATCELADHQPAAAIPPLVEASKLIEAAIATEQLWRLEGAAATYASQFGEILALAHTAFRELSARGDTSADWSGTLYDLVQHFHGFETLFRLLASGGQKATMSAAALAESAALGTAERSWEKVLSTPPRHPGERGKRLLQLAEARRSVDARSTALATLLARDGVAAPLLAPQRYSLRAVQATLDAGDVLVETVETSTTSFAFVLTPTECVVQPLPNTVEWQRVVAELGQWAAEDSALAAAQIGSLQRVGDVLLPEGGWFAKLLASGTVKRLLWSPEGSFAAIPIAAVPFQGKHLVATVGITHTISGSCLVHVHGKTEQPIANLHLLALGNPRYGAATALDLRTRSLVDAPLSELPATAAEVMDIARLFADASERPQLDAIAKPAAFDGELIGRRYRALLGANASEQALDQKSVAAAQVLHFACHGEACADAPNLSFLALSLAGDASEAENNGLLRLSELSELRGDYALVALSACRTSAGSTHGHDAVAGLAWAAQLAGARRVLATLWQVPDEATREFVVAFYRRWLVDGLPCSEALAATQRAAIGKLPVRVWSAFVLWGEPR